MAALSDSDIKYAQGDDDSDESTEHLPTFDELKHPAARFFLETGPRGGVGCGDLEQAPQLTELQSPTLADFIIIGGNDDPDESIDATNAKPPSSNFDRAPISESSKQSASNSMTKDCAAPAASMDAASAAAPPSESRKQSASNSMTKVFGSPAAASMDAASAAAPTDAASSAAAGECRIDWFDKEEIDREFPFERDCGTRKPPVFWRGDFERMRRWRLMDRKSQDEEWAKWNIMSQSEKNRRIDALRAVSASEPGPEIGNDRTHDQQPPAQDVGHSPVLVSRSSQSIVSMDTLSLPKESSLSLSGEKRKGDINERANHVATKKSAAEIRKKKTKAGASGEEETQHSLSGESKMTKSTGLLDLLCSVSASLATPTNAGSACSSSVSGGIIGGGSSSGSGGGSGEVLSSASSLSNSEPSMCSCKLSQCLKLYCECYLKGKLCGRECKCRDCQNTEANSGPEGIRTKAIEAALARRPDAFQPRSRTSGQGCACKRNRCLKKYCDCFSNNDKCGPKCRCKACGNRDAC